MCSGALLNACWIACAFSRLRSSELDIVVAVKTRGATRASKPGPRGGAFIERRGRIVPRRRLVLTSMDIGCRFVLQNFEGDEQSELTSFYQVI